MLQTAKVFVTGRSQAVRLPLEFRFDVTEVFIRRDVQRHPGRAGIRLAPKGPTRASKNALFQVLLRVDVLPWDEPLGRCYGRLCCAIEAQGINLSDLDMMIAAHAVATNTTLVSRDKAFQTLASIAPENLLPDPLRLEIW